MNNIFPFPYITNILSKGAFSYPKPSDLIREVLARITNHDDIILDSFAGSGTTAHAVLDLNRSDGGHRKFILVELGDYAESVTAERVKRVISGYVSPKETTKIIYDKEITVDDLIDGVDELIQEAKETAENEAGNYDKISKLKIEDGHLIITGTVERNGSVSGLDGDFTYYELGDPLFNTDGTLNSAVLPETIRKYIWYAETHIPYAKPENENSAYLGEHNYTAYYFHYKKDELTTLDYNFLAGVNVKADNYVIYADTCLLSSEELATYNITFKKIPRDITKI